ncbi:MAG: DUF72 domain-containing protein [Promethearchaeota archaeon]
MVQIKIGTAGWDYKDWIGSFYPKRLKRSQFLEFYSKYFEIVEINSSFYNLPSQEIVKTWNERVPESFCFIVKVWQKISHNLNDPDLDSYLTEFLHRFKPLNEKILGFLIQFPPWFKFSKEHLLKLSSLIKFFPLKNKIIIELRDNSWFKPEILSKFINSEQIILGTTYMPNLIPYYMPDQKYYYIRLIGDRELTVFNRIQRDQKSALENLDQNIQTLIKSSKIYEIFIIVNNHFQGMAPESVNELKKKWALSYRNFKTQKTLVDFFEE